MLKKFFLSLILGVLVITPFNVHAIDLGGSMVKNAAVKAGYDEATNSTSFAELIGTIIKAVLSFVGVIFLVLMVYAGYLWMTAQGEETQIEKAQGIIRSSIIGMVVMVGAYSITAFVVPTIVEKTAGDSNGSPSGGAGDETILCCVRCQDSNGVCSKSVVSEEGQCVDALGSCQGNTVDYSCSVSPAPASQCVGGISTKVGCCTIDRGGNTPQEKREIQGENVDAMETTCDTICDNANGNNNVGGFECSFEMVDKCQ